MLRKCVHSNSSLTEFHSGFEAFWIYNVLVKPIKSDAILISKIFVLYTIYGVNLKDLFIVYAKKEYLPDWKNSLYLFDIEKKYSNVYYHCTPSSSSEI